MYYYITFFMTVPAPRRLPGDSLSREKSLTRSFLSILRAFGEGGASNIWYAYMCYNHFSIVVLCYRQLPRTGSVTVMIVEELQEFGTTNVVLEFQDK